MTEVTYLPTLDVELLARARRRRARDGSVVGVDPWDVASETRRSRQLPSRQIIGRYEQRGFQEDEHDDCLP